jgi:Peptidase M60, enhancin and enhancin-like
MLGSPSMKLGYVYGSLFAFAACSSDSPAPKDEVPADPSPFLDAAINVDAGTPQEDASVAADASMDAAAPKPAIDPGRPYVDVAPTGPYGTHTFEVPAGAYWVNSGLFLKAGETATLTATGSWKAQKNLPASGDQTSPLRGCFSGGLVARLDLRYADTELTCFNAAGNATLTAKRDGIVYLGSLTETDLGADSYEVRRSFSGALTVTLSSTGNTVPWVLASQASTYPFPSIKSGFVEIYGKHTIVVAATAQAERDKATILASMNFLDTVYDKHLELRGKAPFGGQRIRFITDPSIESLGYMLAGNPIRMNPAVFTGAPSTDGNAEHLLDSANTRYHAWGFAHEMGHTFAITDGSNWSYQVGPFLEAWPNIFSVRTLRAMGRASFDWGGNDATYPSSKICTGRATHLVSGTYESLKTDAQLMLCFLLEFEDTYGSNFFPAFYAKLNALAPNKVPFGSDAITWRWVRDRFSEIAGADTSARFTAWKIPL